MSNATPLVGDDVVTRRLDESLAYTERERVAALARSVIDYGTGELTPVQTLLAFCGLALTDDPGITIRPIVAQTLCGAVVAVMDGAIPADEWDYLRAKLVTAAGVGQ